jgi:hypothetical protein
MPTVDIYSQLQQGNSPVKIFDLGKFVGSISGVVLLVAGIASFAYLLYGGFNWVASGGDKGKIDNARNMITHALIGLAITASVYALFSVVQYFLGIDIVSR